MGDGSAESAERFFTVPDRLDPGHTFASLYQHEGILVAATLVSSLAQSGPGGSLAPSPLVLRGPAGTGKTHLLAAAARQRLEWDPEARVPLLAAGDFLALLGSLAARGGLPQIPVVLRRGDMLLLDELEDLAEKPAALRELCALAAEYAQTGRPVMAAFGLRSRQSPGRLPSVLTDHLPGAKVVEVSPPDRQAAAEILLREVGRLGGRISVVKARTLAAWYARSGDVGRIKELARRIAERSGTR